MIRMNAFASRGLAGSVAIIIRLWRPVVHKIFVNCCEHHKKSLKNLLTSI